MKILVVDDEHPTADRIADLLRKHGHRALSLYSPRDTLLHLKHVWFDLVILDVSSAGLAERILAIFLTPEVMLLDMAETSDELVTKVREIEKRLELEWQQALEFLQSGYGESEPPTPSQGASQGG